MSEIDSFCDLKGRQRLVRCPAIFEVLDAFCLVLVESRTNEHGCHSLSLSELVFLCFILVKALLRLFWQPFWFLVISVSKVQVLVDCA